jgi:N,N'-diacetyllegionaminate synthase
MKKKTLIIAEIGPNHNGKLDLAYKLIDKAKLAGADIVKFQTSVPKLHISSYAKKAKYQETKKKESQLAMAEKITLSLDKFFKLKKYCEKKKIEFMSTPFDLVSLKLLKELNVRRLKIPSGEINNFLLLREIARCKKEIIMSTGMSNLKEIKQALKVIRKYNNKSKISILHCTTQYPAPFKDINLNALKTLKKVFRLDIGYSDHSSGIEVSLAAVALGATVIEKHLTLNKRMKGPDHKASLEPDEFKNLVKSIRNVEKSLGSFEKKITTSEKNILLIARKSIMAKKNIKKNEIFTEDNLTVKRPAHGLSPMLLPKLLGLRAKKKFKIDEFIKI